MILAIGRAERYSPNSVGKDAAIIGCVSEALSRRGIDVECVGESRMAPDSDADVYLSMGRNPATLAFLAARQKDGAVVVNSPAGVALCCDRQRLTAALSAGGVPVPPEEGAHGYWLKRAHGVAESPWDVRYAADRDDVDATMSLMAANGVGEVMVQAHVPGDLVKFYGVRGTHFFRFFYPGDDGLTKFSDELRNGLPHHYPFSVDELRATAGRAAAIAGVDVYGGDCIVGCDGSLCIIDFNDWPSFSRCREEAAEAIADMTELRMACLHIEKRAL